ncbi:MAG: hypothetical protein Q7J78_03620 [Clostridiales bacterium]|nr:hypothetical protein [Clostridiales bacterium]
MNRYLIFKIFDRDEDFSTTAIHAIDAVREGRVPEGGLDSAIQSVEVADCIRLLREEYHSE